MRVLIMGVCKRIGSLVLASAVVLALAAPASAAGAVKTTIQIDVGVTIPGVELFTTTGGALCPSGVATTDASRVAGGGGRGGFGFTFHGFKTLVCNDQTGSFRITFDAATHAGSDVDQGGWHVIDGTGNYENLTGGGNLVGTYQEGGVIDLYTGNVQL